MITNFLRNFFLSRTHVEDAIEDIVSGKVKPTVTIKDGNPAVFTAVFKGVYTETMTATFDNNDECIKFITQDIFATDKLADEAWKDIQANYDADEVSKYFTRKGKTITEDETEFYEGQSHDEILYFFELMKKEFENTSWTN